MTEKGGCVCGETLYSLSEEPFWTQACHCFDCQRITGSAFVVNAWIHQSFFEFTGTPASHASVGGSGKQHDIHFCSKCGTTLWSRYHAAPTGHLFLRAGTLNDTSALTPKAHIFTAQKQPWVVLPEGVPTFASSYNMKEVWPTEALERFRSTLAK